VCELGAGIIAGEIVFVPRAPAGAETDGWLVHFQTDLAADRTTLVVRDAADPAGAPRAIVRLPLRVPVGAHSSWIRVDEWQALR
jgi:8'-apo-carotenoid 13,14-cleaving dioxygenase